jgi:multiple sugar transport system ATP-binding protein
MEIAKLKRSMPSTTMIYVTHDQVEAMTLADRIVVLQAGRVEQVGTPMELYDAPANIFVAGFIGSPKMNFITGAPAAACHAHTIGVRPEHFTISADHGQITGTVEYTEVLGSDSFLYIKAPEGLLTAREEGKTSFKPGSTAHLSPVAARVHRFGEDGQRL